MVFGRKQTVRERATHGLSMGKLINIEYKKKTKPFVRVISSMEDLEKTLNTVDGLEKALIKSITFYDGTMTIKCMSKEVYERTTDYKRRLCGLGYKKCANYYV